MSQPVTVSDLSPSSVEAATPASETTSEPRKSLPFLWFFAAAAPLAGIPWMLTFSEMFPGKSGTLCGFVLLSATLVAAIDDHRRGKIPNWITYPAFVWLLFLNLVFSVVPGEAVFFNRLGGIGLGSSLLGAVCCFAVVLVPYILGMGGAGDAKIAAVIGAALGVTDGLLALGLTFVVAALTMILYVIATKGPVFVFYTMYRRLGSWLVFWIVPPDSEQKRFLDAPLAMGPSFLFGVVFTITGAFQSLLTFS